MKIDDKRLRIDAKRLKDLGYQREGKDARFYLAELEMGDEERKAYLEKRAELIWAAAYDVLDKLEERMLQGTKKRAQNIIKTSKNTLDVGVAYGILGEHKKLLRCSRNT